MKTMVKIACILSAGCLMAQAVEAQPKIKLQPNKTVLLYQESPVSFPDPVQGKTIEALGLEMAEANGFSGEETIQENGNIGNISDLARVDLYFPKKPNGQMIVVCPGGGYTIVSSYNEGVYVADRMLSQGISVAVVKYRLPNGHWTIPLTDVQNVFRYCREHAREWGIKQIGVMGFSAGGHLAASATTLYTDEITKPDFSVLIYPVIAMDDVPSHEGSRICLMGNDEKWTSPEGKTASQWIDDQETYKGLRQRYSLYKNVTKDTPPVFLTHCSDDGVVPVTNSIVFYNAMISCGLTPEMHIFPVGGHGWGFSLEKYVGWDGLGYARTEFETSLFRWLGAQLGE